MDTARQRPFLFRPPFGFETKRTVFQSEKMGCIVVNWSVSSRDWKRPGVQQIVRNILRRVHNGSIVLMHDGNKCLGGDRSQTVQALAKSIPVLKQKGYEFVTVPELLSLEP